MVAAPITDNDTYCNHSIKHELEPLLLVGCGSASVCVFMCLISITAMIFFRLFNFLTHRLILFLLITILLSSLVDAVQFLVLLRKYWQGEHIGECMIGGVLMEYTVWVMFLATLVITLHLTSMVLLPTHYEKIAKLEPFYLLFPWIFPLFIAWIPFVHNNYGLSGPWCWIRVYNEDCSPNKEGMIEMYATWYGELFVGLILNNVGLVIIAITLCKRSCNSSSLSMDYMMYRKALKQTLPLLAYPITYQFLSSFAIANRLYQAAHGGHSVRWLFYAHAATSPCWGVFAPVFTFIYIVALSKVAKENIKKWWKFCPKRTRRNKISDCASPSHKVTDRLVDPTDRLTQYGITVTSPTISYFGRESEVDEEYQREKRSAQC